MPKAACATSVFKPALPRFHITSFRVAQWLACAAHNRKVGGSIPPSESYINVPQQGSQIQALCESHEVEDMRQYLVVGAGV